MKFIKDIISSTFLMIYCVVSLVIMYMGFHYIRDAGYSDVYGYAFLVIVFLLIFLLYVFYPRRSAD